MSGESKSKGRNGNPGSIKLTGKAGSKRTRIVKKNATKKIYQRKTNISKPGSARRDKAKTRRGYSCVIQEQLNKPPLSEREVATKRTVGRKGERKTWWTPGRDRAPTVTRSSPRFFLWHFRTWNSGLLFTMS